MEFAEPTNLDRKSGMWGTHGYVVRTNVRIKVTLQVHCAVEGLILSEERLSKIGESHPPCDWRK